MSDPCSFLENGLGKPGLLCCGAGVNFYAVGQAREICQPCPLSNGNRAPTCEFLEAYTFLHGEKEQQQVEIRFDCWLPKDEAALPHCATCPAKGTSLSQKITTQAGGPKCHSEFKRFRSSIW
jgi:hypothetical protein